jgi:uncharacterized protein YicC (UPF0701 family)
MNGDYHAGMIQGRIEERKQITNNIRERIKDLRACGKTDNCQELATLIESYIPEWIEAEQIPMADKSDITIGD